MKQKLFLDIGIDKINKKDIIEINKNKDFITSHYLVSKENKKTYKKEIGDYFIIEFPHNSLYTKSNVLAKETERILKSFLKKYQNNKKVLIIGLGNENIDGDAIGAITTNKLIATNQYEDFLTIPKIALFNPSVIAKTGISSFKLITMVVNYLKPDCLIMIDALVTNNEKYLNSAIEINNTGIIPGSAINSSKEINSKTFNIPVLTIGIPCCLEYKKKFYTSILIHEVLEKTSNILAKSLTNIFLKN